MIRNPQALFSNLAQQHTKYAGAVMADRGWTVGYVRTMSDDEARIVCEAVQDAVMARWGHKAYTAQAITKSLVEAYGTPEAAYEAAADKVNVWAGLTFKTNPGNGEPRRAKPIEQQKAEFREMLGRAHRFILAEGTPEAEIPATIEPTIEVKAPAPSNALESDIRQLLVFTDTMRTWQAEQDLEQWGYRQDKNGVALLCKGFPLDALKDAFTIDFDPEARRHHGVKEFDLMRWGRSVAVGDETALEAILRVISSAGVNAATVGQPGIGKTHTIEAMAERDGVHLVVVSCNPDTAGAEFFGVLTPGLNEGYVLSDFSKALLMAETGTKVRILLDEMDALDSAGALVLNRALEQRKFSHRFLGRTIDFGSNVEFFGAMNTNGTGATEDNTGRERQDSAFLNRFIRIRVGFDAKVRDAIVAATMAKFVTA